MTAAHPAELSVASRMSFPASPLSLHTGPDLPTAPSVMRERSGDDAYGTMTRQHSGGAP